MDKRLLLALATLGYCLGLIAALGPDPWMWRVWIPAWLVFGAPAIVFVARRGREHVTDAFVPWVAGVAFSIVAVMAAVMETRPYESVDRVFWALGLGMAGSVSLFLMSYDRSKRPEAEAPAD